MEIRTVVDYLEFQIPLSAITESYPVGLEVPPVLSCFLSNLFQESIQVSYHPIQPNQHPYCKKYLHYFHPTNQHPGHYLQRFGSVIYQINPRNRVAEDFKRPNVKEPVFKIKLTGEFLENRQHHLPIIADFIESTRRDNCKS